MARRDARRILVVVLRARCRNADERRTKQRRIAKSGGADGTGGRGMHAAADETGLELLVGSEPGNVHGIYAVAERYGAGNEPAVISPIEADPRAALPRLILQVGGLVELFVVVDAEDTVATLAYWRGADTAQLRLEEPGRHARHHHQCGEPVKIRHAGANRVARNLGALPFDRKRDRRAAEHAEIVRAVRVLPDVFGIDHQVLAERLLEPGVKFISPSGSQRIGVAWIALERRHQRVDHDIVAAGA